MIRPSQKWNFFHYFENSCFFSMKRKNRLNTFFMMFGLYWFFLSWNKIKGKRTNYLYIISHYLRWTIVSFYFRLFIFVRLTVLVSKNLLSSFLCSIDWKSDAHRFLLILKMKNVSRGTLFGPTNLYFVKSSWYSSNLKNEKNLLIHLRIMISKNV